ncbi:hypothetical protein RF11_09216 [Thelohanellus kitauei]|uniref:Uncharacterized protein n=1 Tax=Thelohanellus kitauei TaxID=669202 RepID=A0A0C2JPB7_THEKT|nr:hypothetical protein RF11_09216 [Thelohanellus kitauei]
MSTKVEGICPCGQSLEPCSGPFLVLRNLALSIMKIQSCIPLEKNFSKSSIKEYETSTGANRWPASLTASELPSAYSLEELHKLYRATARISNGRVRRRGSNLNPSWIEPRPEMLNNSSNPKELRNKAGTRESTSTLCERCLFTPPDRQERERIYSLVLQRLHRLCIVRVERGGQERLTLRADMPLDKDWLSAGS